MGTSQRTIRAGVSLGLGLTLGLAGPAWGEAKLIGKYIQPFLGRAHPEGYTNYAVVAPRNYVDFPNVDKQFDDFGNYQLEGFSLWYWEERRPGEGKGNNVALDGSFRAVAPTVLALVWDVCVGAGPEPGLECLAGRLGLCPHPSDLLDVQRPAVSGGADGRQFAEDPGDTSFK